MPEARVNRCDFAAFEIDEEPLAMTTRDSATDQAADDIVQRFIKERGDLFEEFHLFARESPDTVDLVRKTAG